MVFCLHSFRIYSIVSITLLHIHSNQSYSSTCIGVGAAESRSVASGTEPDAGVPGAVSASTLAVAAAVLARKKAWTQFTALIDILKSGETKFSKDAAAVYYCDNETVDGVEFREFPKSLAPGPDGEGPIVVADMSSNILSRRVPVRNYSLIFFGAQKNLGSTGITVVIIKKSLLPPSLPQPSATLMRNLGLPIAPIIFSYETIAKNNSLYNTLSIFE